MIHYTGTYTDQYEIAMAQVYFLSGRTREKAVFDYFFRKLPMNSGYVIFAGLHDLLRVLETLRFDEEDLFYLREQNHDPDFLEYLKSFRFNGTIHSCEEGEVVFPNEPILRVEGSILEAQLIETLLLNLLNFQSLIATKASRIRSVSGKRTLLEFGLRRAQGPGGYYATRASIIGGFDGTSHVRAARDFGLKAGGTMAHSFVQSEKDELTAFRRFAEYRPEDCVLLVDTYSTLLSGLPNAITVAKEMEQKGQKLLGIRLDSGDIAYLSKECRKRLDNEGLDYVKIVASNQLDETVIESVLNQGGQVDVFGVGTNLVIGQPDGALDGVYKLSEINGEPKIKLSESVSKVSFPHKKQIYRVLSPDGKFYGADAVGMVDEQEIQVMHHPFEVHSSLVLRGLKMEPLLKKQMENGRRLSPSPSILNIKHYAQERLELLPPEYKRFMNPHIYKIGLTERLKEVRDRLILQCRGMQNENTSHP